MFKTFFMHARLLPILGVILLALPGCKQPAYTPKSLQEIRLKNTSSQTQNNVVVHCKLLTKQETHLLFDGRGSRLLHKRKPIYPLYLYIENNTQKSLILNPANIQLKMINPELVAERLYSHTSRRIIVPLIVGTFGAGVTFLAAAYISIIGAIGSFPILIKSGYAGLGLSGLVAATTPYICYQQGNTALTTNRAIYEDVMNKSLHKPAIIEPGQSLKTLLFVPHKCYNSSFNMRLVDAACQQPLRYDIAIEEGESLCKN